MRRIKTVAAVALTAVFAFHTPVLATSEPPASPQEESSSPETPPATQATEAPTTAAEAPSTAPDAGTTTTYIDPAITEAIIETPVEVTTTNAQVNQDQAVIIEATVVADANSGGNTVLAGTSVGSSAPAEIDTGSATAVGSDDANVVTQGAEITLEDQATANVIQVALILNVGLAFANSGYNSVGAAPGAAGLTGGIATGDASAEGLDIDQYITQASRETATRTPMQHSNQLVISLWMGLGTANSGLNNVSGPGVGIRWICQCG